jgi:hypothetical protein
MIRYVLLKVSGMEYLATADLARKSYTPDLSKAYFFSDLNWLARTSLLESHQLIPVKIEALA